MTTKSESISTLHHRLLVPEFFELHDASDYKQIHVVPVESLVRHVLDDDHPGDDVYPPRWLPLFCRETFSPQKLRAILRKSGNEPVPLLEVARDCIKHYSDDILCWSSAAFSEFGWAASCRGNALTLEQAATVMCLVALAQERPTKRNTKSLPEASAAMLGA